MASIVASAGLLAAHSRAEAKISFNASPGNIYQAFATLFEKVLTFGGTILMKSFRHCAAMTPRMNLSRGAAGIANRVAGLVQTAAARGICLRLAAVLLAGTSPVTAHAATYVWSSGVYMPGVTSPNPLLLGEILSIQTSASKTFDADFTNSSGRVDWRP